MTSALWGFLLGGTVMTFVSTIFFSVKYHALYEQLQESLNHNRQQVEAITDLKANQHQVIWDDARQPTHSEMKERHPSLIEAGTEIIRIDTLDDVPEIAPPSWRGKTGQGGET